MSPTWFLDRRSRPISFQISSEISRLFFKISRQHAPNPTPDLQAVTMMTTRTLTGRARARGRATDGSARRSRRTIRGRPSRPFSPSGSRRSPRCPCGSEDSSRWASSHLNSSPGTDIRFHAPGTVTFPFQQRRPKKHKKRNSLSHLSPPFPSLSIPRPQVLHPRHAPLARA